MSWGCRGRPSSPGSPVHQKEKGQSPLQSLRQAQPALRGRQASRARFCRGRSRAFRGFAPGLFGPKKSRSVARVVRHPRRPSPARDLPRAFRTCCPRGGQPCRRPKPLTRPAPQARSRPRSVPLPSPSARQALTSTGPGPCAIHPGQNLQAKI